MNFPFPKTREGVLAALLLTAVLFLLYYCFAFDSLLKIYDKQFETIIYDNGDCEGIDVIVKVPKTVYRYGSQFVYVSVENTSQYEFQNVAVQFIVVDEKDKKSRNMLLLPSFFEGNVFEDTVLIKSLPPKFEKTGRLLLMTKGEFKVSDAKLTISCGRDAGFKTPDVDDTIKSASLQPVLHTMLERVLLPPWSNGVIPALAVLSAWLFENENRGVKRGDNSKNKGTAQKTYEISMNEICRIMKDIIRITGDGLIFNAVVWFIIIIIIIIPALLIALVILLFLTTLPSICEKIIKKIKRILIERTSKKKNNDTSSIPKVEVVEHAGGAEKLLQPQLSSSEEGPIVCPSCSLPVEPDESGGCPNCGHYLGDKIARKE